MPMKQKFFHALITAIAGLSIIMLSGCSSSDEAERDRTVTPPATALMTKEINDLKAENGSLKDQVSRLQQENRTLTARVAEMETQLAEPKEKPVSTPTEEP